jgi:hypothetical protein
MKSSRQIMGTANIGAPMQAMKRKPATRLLIVGWPFPRQKHEERMSISNVETLAESQEELRVMQDLRKAMMDIPRHLWGHAFTELAKKFPEIEIKINGKKLWNCTL